MRDNFGIINLRAYTRSENGDCPDLKPKQVYTILIPRVCFYFLLMKTRVIRTSIWRELLDQPMNIDTKLLYMYLLTNEHIGQTDYLKIFESEISFYTGLDQKQIRFCLNQLQDVGLIRVFENWIMFTDGGYVQSQYKGKKNEKAKEKELSEVPAHVLHFFSDTLSIPYTYPSDTSINNKSYIINTKSKSLSNKKEKKGYSEFSNVFLSDDEIKKLIDKIGHENTHALIEELGLYIEGHGKAKKYKSHYAVIQAWCRKRNLEAKKNQKQITFIDASI